MRPLINRVAQTAVVLVPVTTWDDQRDTTCFRCVVGLFPPAFAYAAGVLLAGYDQPEAAA
jgi:hypothetical protein